MGSTPERLADSWKPMPDFLADPPFLLYALLGCAAAGAGFVWFRTRKKAAGVAALALLGVLALVAAADVLVETPLEEADRRLRLMNEAAARKDWTAAFEHVSEQFRFKGSDKKTFQDRVAKTVAAYNVTVRFKRIERDTVEYRPDGTFKVGFVVQADSPQAPDGRFLTYIEAVFGPDPDGAYRMRSAVAYDFIQRKTELPVPGL